MPPTPNKGLLRRWTFPVLISGIVATIGGGCFLAYVLLDPWQWFLNQSRYNEIVRRIDASGIPPGKEMSYLISFDKDPETLKPASELQALPNLYQKLVDGEVIEARRFPDGRLRVWIKMPGRRPTYGVVYSSGAPEKGELENSFGAGSWTHPLAEHWWAIEDRSD